LNLLLNRRSQYAIKRAKIGQQVDTSDASVVETILSWSLLSATPPLMALGRRNVLRLLGIGRRSKQHSNAQDQGIRSFIVTFPAMSRFARLLLRTVAPNLSAAVAAVVTAIRGDVVPGIQCLRQAHQVSNADYSSDGREEAHRNQKTPSSVPRAKHRLSRDVRGFHDTNRDHCHQRFDGNRVEALEDSRKMSTSGAVSSLDACGGRVNDCPNHTIPAGAVIADGIVDEFARTRQ